MQQRGGARESILESKFTEYVRSVCGIVRAERATWKDYGLNARARRNDGTQQKSETLAGLATSLGADRHPTQRRFWRHLAANSQPPCTLSHHATASWLLLRPCVVSKYDFPSFAAALEKTTVASTTAPTVLVRQYGMRFLLEVRVSRSTSHVQAVRGMQCNSHNVQQVKQIQISWGCLVFPQARG